MIKARLFSDYHATDRRDIDCNGSPSPSFVHHALYCLTAIYNRRIVITAITKSFGEASRISPYVSSLANFRNRAAEISDTQLSRKNRRKRDRLRARRRSPTHPSYITGFASHASAIQSAFDREFLWIRDARIL